MAIRIEGAFGHPDVFRARPEIPSQRVSQNEPFSKVIKDVIEKAAEADIQAEQAIYDFAAGKIEDVHDVMMAVNKANLAIQLLVQVRNGILEAYHELSRISL